MHILVATDADWVLDELRAALEEPGTTFTICRNGREVSPAVAERTPDLAIIDLQIGSMGGFAVTMSLRLDESAGAAPHVRVLALLDRAADVHLARRSGADGWLIKPLDALRLRRAVRALNSGETVTEGLPPVVDETAIDAALDTESADEERVASG